MAGSLYAALQEVRMRIETGDGRPIVAAGAVEELLRPMTLPALPPQPLVSVLVVNYNYAEYIGEAIESVLEIMSRATQG